MKRIVTTILSLGMVSLIVACNATATSEDDEGVAEDGVASADALTGSIAVGATFTTTARVNLRQGPATSADVILTIPNGSTVKALEAAPKNGFYHIAYESHEGWSFGAYLKASGTAPPPDTTTPDAGTPDSGGPGTGDPGNPGDFHGRTFSGVTVLWQGNWAFLVRCDSYSRNAGHVVFFCDENPSRSFVDDGAWLAMPRANFSSGSCGKSARVCKGSRCIVAKIVEKSETVGQWEGSASVLKALGVNTGFSGCSSSFGTATGVTITMQ